MSKTGPQLPTTPSSEDIEEKPGKPTSKDTIASRLKAGKEFMDPYVLRSTRNANRYLDSSTNRLNGRRHTDEKLRDLPVGEINQIATNIRLKVAASAIGIPDWQVESDQPEAAPIVRDYLRKWWHKRKWGRVFRRVLTSRFVTGMGFVAYMWDRDDGFLLQYVAPEDVMFDPHTDDETWDNPRWAAYRIRLPVDVAEEMYGKDALLEQSDVTSTNSYDPNMPESIEKQNIEIWLYYDENTEAQVSGETVLKSGPNLYGRVPIRTLCGDVNPVGRFPMGDYDTSLGIFEMLRRQQNILNNVAANGGGVLWMNTAFIDDRIVESVINGEHNGPVLLKGVPDGNAAIGYTANQPINPANLESIKMMQQGLDGDQGVTDLDRGIAEIHSETATQTALRANRSGGRAGQMRAEFEEFVESIGKECVRLTVQFGLDPEQQDIQQEDVLIWQALQSVTDLRVIEESLSFKDPATKQQQAMQIFNLAVSSFQLMNALGTPPNLKMLFDEILRSYDRRDVDKYYLQSGGITGAMQQQQQGQGQAQQPPPGGNQ